MPIIKLLLAVAITGALAVAPVAFAEVEIRDIEVGEGAVAERHSVIQVHYTGWLEDGTQFDSSRTRGQPFTLVLGQGQVIPGWEQGLLGMREGGKRELVIPPHLAYGERGAGGVIPPNATLRFEVELVAVAAPPYGNLSNDELAELAAEGVTLIDIRRPDEWQQTGVVEGSYLLTAFDWRGRFVPDFPEQLAQLVERDEPFMIICRVGNRTAFLARALAEQLDYEQVYNITEGITDWIADGRTVTRACPEFESGVQCRSDGN
ncbi:peptidylprolyl isomerase [Halorhodospira abdelmalekii]|uniref:FKBP-type peptidyl-prolyl cis-trans isomerase n=1 Tax=Halorhodospira abdelmalekii TaxID=421629 RepID=UPI001905CC39|nr:FKBP-type peptidyl-prolyl cis-trans isomerase [Halorhodospira abdelmalekii]MBK1734799.1 peptidylprolyl isomerase [Halorhodospira abdelmalekii]